MDGCDRLFITVGVLTVEHAYAEGQHHEPRCTLKTLKGRYLFSQAANLLPPAFGITAPTPGNAAGFHIFNGDGTGTDIVTLRIGGATVFSNALAPFTYTVNADCTGSYNMLPTATPTVVRCAPSSARYRIGG